jgi:hypothetical protein
MKRLIIGSFLLAAFMLPTIGCGGGGSKIQDPPKDKKFELPKSTGKKTNAATGKEPDQTLPPGFGGGKEKDQ